MHAEDPQLHDEDYAYRGTLIILLAEKDVIFRNLLRSTLDNNSYNVFVASSENEALKVSRTFEGEISLLVTESEMLRINGGKLEYLIMQERPGIRIIQISEKFAENFVDGSLTGDILQQSSGTAIKLLKTIREVMTAAPPGTKEIIS